jgi:hypothetical protein
MSPGAAAVCLPLGASKVALAEAAMANLARALSTAASHRFLSPGNRKGPHPVTRKGISGRATMLLPKDTYRSATTAMAPDINATSVCKMEIILIA